jgi:predicted DNA-binding protein (UPF0251 family)
MNKRRSVVFFQFPPKAPLFPMSRKPVTMTPDELEALRLVDYEGLLQERDCGEDEGIQGYGVAVLG